jgi:glycosyltransferase involved in cell wall biosynthesis
MSNGIDMHPFISPVSRDKAKAVLGYQDKVLVLFVGRLVVQKSLPTLLKAFQQAVAHCPELHLVLVGNGPEYNTLLELARELNILVNITFTGNQEDVKPYLFASDIFVLPSETEGMSNALLEGMAAGLPCLATPVGASAEMLDFGRCGLLLPVGDVSAWGQALVDLGRSPRRCAELGKAARQRIMAEYDFSVIGARYKALYEDLTEKTAGQTEPA